MPIKTENPPVVCIVGRSGSGKTTVIEKLVPELRRHGLRVGTIKHHIGEFELDLPGKDSWRHKQAGSVNAMISSPQRIGLVMDVDHDSTPEDLAPFFKDVDIILGEGYKRGNHPKVEIFRPEIHKKPFCTDDHWLIALICDVSIDLGVPRFTTSDTRGLARYLIDRFKIPGREG